MPSWPLGTKIQPLFAVDAVNLLVIDIPSFPTQQDIDSTTAIPYTALGDIADTQPQGRIRLSHGLVVIAGPSKAEDGTPPACTDLISLIQIICIVD